MAQVLHRPLPVPRNRKQTAEVNRLESADRPAHNWYRFVLSYPPHLVRDYVESFGLADEACVLDPFCATGTTPVECKKLGVRSVGVEAHPMSHLAPCTKLAWSLGPDKLEAPAVAIVERALEKLTPANLRLCHS